jgi:hypothetical protein
VDFVVCVEIEYADFLGNVDRSLNQEEGGELTRGSPGRDTAAARAELFLPSMPISVVLQVESCPELEASMMCPMSS